MTAGHRRSLARPTRGSARAGRSGGGAQAGRGCLVQIRACQLPDGAFAQVPPGGRPDAPVWIAPYFAHFAALALLAAHERGPNPGDLRRAERWLAWCAKHQAPDGYWTDFEGTAAAYRDTGKVDAWDSSAALFLRVAEGARRAGGTVTPDTLAAAQRALACLEKVTDADGLTWAKPDYRMKYLMDNVEVVAGLQAAAALFAAAGRAGQARQAADQAGQAARRLPEFWQAEEGSFAFARRADGSWVVGPDKPYPRRLAQLYGLAFVEARADAWASVAKAFEPAAEPDAACGAAWWLAAASRQNARDLPVWRARAIAEAAAFSPQRTYLNRYALSALALLEGADWLSARPVNPRDAARHKSTP